MADPDWSQLPKDLLQLISKKLNSQFYQLRFRSVCSSWRSSSVPKNHHLLGHEFVIGDLLSEPFSEPWIMFFNLFFMKKIVVSDTLHCSVLLTIHVSGKLTVFPISDEQWTIMPEMPPMPYTDVCVFNGRLIAVDSTGRTVAVGPDLSLDLVAEAVFGGDTKILVESDGELLLVDKYLKPCMHGTVFFEGQGEYKVREIESTARLVVFRLDEKEKKWVELTNLGEECAFSVSASDLGMENGNCVIFIDHVHHFYHSNELGISVFCLDKCRISPLSDFPSWSKLFWPPPQWAGLC